MAAPCLLIVTPSAGAGEAMTVVCVTLVGLMNKLLKCKWVLSGDHPDTRAGAPGGQSG